MSIPDPPTASRQPSTTFPSGLSDGNIEIILNGNPHRVTTGATVAGLLATLDTPAHGVAVAVNRVVVARGRWIDQALHAGDRVDIVRAIGGG